MPTSAGRRRGAPKLAAAVCVAAAVLLGLVAPAYAFPSGYPTNCTTIATGIYTGGNTWNNLCWVSTSYSSNSELTSGVQGFLTMEGYSPGSWDKQFGSNTEAAVEDYQGDEGLSVDGVVGTNTWGHIEADITFAPSQCYPNAPVPYCDMYIVLGTGAYILYLGWVGYVYTPWGVIDPSGNCMHWLATYVASC